LATQIPLTKEERLEAIQKIKAAHQQKLEKQTKSATPSPTPTGKK
jgi:hypothetical protein